MYWCIYTSTYTCVDIDPFFFPRIYNFPKKRFISAEKNTTGWPWSNRPQQSQSRWSLRFFFLEGMATFQPAQLVQLLGVVILMGFSTRSINFSFFGLGWGSDLRKSGKPFGMITTWIVSGMWIYYIKWINWCFPDFVANNRRWKMRDQCTYETNIRHLVA